MECFWLQLELYEKRRVGFQRKITLVYFSKSVHHPEVPHFVWYHCSYNASQRHKVAMPFVTDKRWTRRSLQVETLVVYGMSPSTVIQPEANTTLAGETSIITSNVQSAYFIVLLVISIVVSK